MPRTFVLVSIVIIASAGQGCTTELAVLGSADGGASDTSQPPDAVRPIDASRDAGLGASVARGVAAGVEHSCAIVSGGLFCWGTNGAGQLGLGDTTNRAEPVRVGTRRDWVQVSAGEFHTCGITADASLFCWGENANGQLGIGGVSGSAEPTLVAFGSAVTYVDVGYRHSCAITEDRALHCWGDNVEGQLGLDDWDSRSSPTALTSGVRWARVALGQASSIASSEDGQLWGWGRNSQDQLGLGPGALVQRQSPTFIADGTFQIVAAGPRTSGALSQGDLHAWGDNSSAQFGDGTRIAQDSPILVVAGREYMDYDVGTFSGCAIARVQGEEGTLHCWGRNAEGQLGTGDNDDRLSPAQVGTLDDWAQVSVGRFHMCARRTDGSVYCTGANSEGKLGVGDLERRNTMTPVAIGPL